MEDGALGGLYVNTNYPYRVNTNYPYRAEEPNLAAMFADACRGDDLPCRLYHYGLRGGRQAIADANAHHVSAPLWWIDVETFNRWSHDVSLNNRVIQGSIDALREAGIRVGIYSTAYQWGVITGGTVPPRGRRRQRVVRCRRGRRPRHVPHPAPARGPEFGPDQLEAELN